MSHVARDKNKLLARVRRIRGQTEALERAIDGEQDCAQVLHQIAGIRGAVNGLMNQVLEGHIREHVAGTGATDRDRATDALVAVLRSYLR